jgi:predicted Zn-dependent peptidase
MTTAPALPPPPHPSDLHPAWRSLTLPNGLAAHLADLPGRRLAAIRLIFWSGAAGSRPGLALALAHSLLQGTARRGTLAFSSHLESCGASSHVTAVPGAACVDLTVPAGRVAPAAELLAEAVFEPALTDKGITDVLARLQISAAHAAERPAAVVIGQARRMLYAGDPVFAEPPEGTPSSLTALGPDDIRAAWQQGCYPAGMTVIAAAGDRRGRLSRALAATLGSSSAGEAATVPAGPPVPAPAAGASGTHVVDLRRTAQAVVACGRVVIVPTQAEAAALRAVTHLLGGWFAARLVRVLREERGYTYGVAARCEVTRTQSGHACEILITSAFREAIAGEAIRELLAQVGRVADGDFSEDEWRRSGQNLIRSHLISLSTAPDLVGAHAPLVQAGYGIGTFAEMSELTAGIGLGVAREVAGQYLNPGQMTLVVGGDGASLRTQLGALASGQGVQ